MARVKCIGIRETLTSLLPKAEIERLARESGAMRRRRKVEPGAMFWCVVLGFGTGAECTLAGLRRSYERATGKSLAPSSFYDRFTPELARMFRAVLAQLIKKLASSEVRYGGVLEGFRDVLAADATVIKLHRLLARRFPGTRTNSSPAAAKLHLVMSVRGNCIDRNGGYYITRLAANANPRIVAVHRQWRRRTIELEGKRLKVVAGRLQRDVLDVEVEVAFQRRAYAGIRRTIRRRVRLVAVRLPESSEYRFYLTNIDPDSLDARAVAQTYEARMQIELILKELKSHYRLDELPTSKTHIVEILLLGTVITLLVSRRLLQAVRERLRRTAYRMPEQRWAALFAGAATAILDIVVWPARVSKVIARRLESMLLHDAPDPNRSRRLLIERVEAGATSPTSPTRPIGR